jgi:hypothetical protein
LVLLEKKRRGEETRKGFVVIVILGFAIMLTKFTDIPG